MKKIIMGISGASGMPLAATLLQALRAIPSLEIHAVISSGAQEVLRAEGAPVADSLLSYPPLHTLAHTTYDPHDTGAPPASGSWQHDGMIVCPCSMATLAAIATGAGQNLLHRAADVTLKERRPLIIVPRETPLSRIHLRNMLAAQEAGAVIMPFCPAFYSRPRTVQDLLDHMAGRVLDQLHLPHQLGHRWQGSPPPQPPQRRLA